MSGMTMRDFFDHFKESLNDTGEYCDCCGCEDHDDDDMLYGCEGEGLGGGECPTFAHSSCIGRTLKSHEEYICTGCEYRRRKLPLRCCLCPRPLVGEMLSYETPHNKVYHAHRFCVRWFSEASVSDQPEVKVWSGPASIPIAAFTHPCHYCGLIDGATVRCGFPTCQRWLHPVCASLLGLSCIDIKSEVAHEFMAACGDHTAEIEGKAVSRQGRLGKFWQSPPKELEGTIVVQCAKEIEMLRRVLNCVRKARVFITEGGERNPQPGEVWARRLVIMSLVKASLTIQYLTQLHKAHKKKLQFVSQLPVSEEVLDMNLGYEGFQWYYGRNKVEVPWNPDPEMINRTLEGANISIRKVLEQTRLAQIKRLILGSLVGRPRKGSANSSFTQSGVVPPKLRQQMAPSSSMENKLRLVRKNELIRTVRVEVWNGQKRPPRASMYAHSNQSGVEAKASKKS